MLTSGQWEYVLWRLAGHLSGFVPQFQEWMKVIMDGEHNPEPVTLHQLGKCTRFLLIVGKPFKETVFVNLPDEEGWSDWHWSDEGTIF